LAETKLDFQGDRIWDGFSAGRRGLPRWYRTNITGNPRCYRHRADLDIGGGYRLTPKISPTVSARNIFNEPYRIMEQAGTNAPAVQFYEVNGTSWTFAVKRAW
jgi:hypothetical protein